MSYDLKLTSGDISFGVDGNPALVRDTDKLAQDISKILLTPKGLDAGNNLYGTTLRGILGKPMDFSVIQGLAAKTVSQALSFLQSLQTIQSSEQTLTYEEMIGSIDAIAVVQTDDNSVEVQAAVKSVAGLRQVYAMNLSQTT